METVVGVWSDCLTAVAVDKLSRRDLDFLEQKSQNEYRLLQHSMSTGSYAGELEEYYA